MKTLQNEIVAISGGSLGIGFHIAHPQEGGTFVQIVFDNRRDVIRILSSRGSFQRCSVIFIRRIRPKYIDSRTTVPPFVTLIHPLSRAACKKIEGLVGIPQTAIPIKIISAFFLCRLIPDAVEVQQLHLIVEIFQAMDVVVIRVS